MKSFTTEEAMLFAERNSRVGAGKQYETEAEEIVMELDADDKLDLVLEALRELTQKVDDLTAQQEEIVEKIANLTLENDGYGRISMLES